MTDTLNLPADLLEILACPKCHAKFAVDYDTEELICSSSACGLAFPVRDGIPVLLIDEARPTLDGPATPGR